MRKADAGKVKVVRDDALIVAVDIGMEMNRGSTEQNFTPILYNCAGKALHFGSFFVPKFSLLPNSISINDSKYPKTNNNVENNIQIGICG